MADKVLWTGKFLDGILTIILPETPVPCAHTAQLSFDNVALVYIVQSHNVEYINHFHIETPVDHTLETQIDEVLINIQRDYLEVIMETRNHGALAH